MMPSRLVAVLLAAALSCAHSASRRDHAAVAQLAIDAVDPKRVATIVFAPNVPEHVRRYFSTVRPVRRDLTGDELRYLPSDVLRIDLFVVDADVATLKAWLGPVPYPERGALACGSGYTLYLHRDEGVWRRGRLTLTVC